MKKLQFVVYPAVAVLALAASLSSEAAPGSGCEADPPVRWAGTTTRTQVNPQLLQARSGGTLGFYSQGDHPLPVTAATRSRSEVRAEAIAARDAGYDGQFREGSSGLHFAERRAPADNRRILAGLAR